MIGFGRRWGAGWLPSALAVLVALTGSIGLAVAIDEPYRPAGRTAAASACDLNQHVEGSALVGRFDDDDRHAGVEDELEIVSVVHRRRTGSAPKCKRPAGGRNDVVVSLRSSRRPALSGMRDRDRRRSLRASSGTCGSAPSAHGTQQPAALR